MPLLSILALAPALTVALTFCLIQHSLALAPALTVALFESAQEKRKIRRAR